MNQSLPIGVIIVPLDVIIKVVPIDVIKVVLHACHLRSKSIRAARYAVPVALCLVQEHFGRGCGMKPTTFPLQVATLTTQKSSLFPAWKSLPLFVLMSLSLSLSLSPLFLMYLSLCSLMSLCLSLSLSVCLWDQLWRKPPLGTAYACFSVFLYFSRLYYIIINM